MTATARTGEVDGSDGGVGDGDGDGDVDSLVGMTIVLGAWVMLFAALFFAYGVVRVQAPEWPPFGAPRLPRGTPGLNTLLLLASSVTLRRGLAQARRGRAGALLPALVATMVLGAGFLAAQIAMWRGMSARGLLPSSGIYGSVFFAFTGFHAAHVLGGLVILGALVVKTARRHGATLTTPPALAMPRTLPLRAGRLTALYWDFIAVVWVLMYLSIFLL